MSQKVFVFYGSTDIYAFINTVSALNGYMLNHYKEYTNDLCLFSYLSRFIFEASIILLLSTLEVSDDNCFSKEAFAYKLPLTDQNILEAGIYSFASEWTLAKQLVGFS